MKPIDPRLLKYAASARSFFALGAMLALAQTACIVAFAWLVSSIVVDAIAGTPLAELAPSLLVLGGVIVLRSVLVWLMELNAARGAAVVKSQLRQRLLASIVTLGPGWLASRNSVGVATVATGGLDALDTYFAKYLPQLILTALATPLLVAVLFATDLTSGIIVLLTLPLVPVFMMLIGWATQAMQKTQWQKLGELSTGFLDVVEGLSTLKVFGREKRQARRIRSVTDDYRASTMKVLRMSFLSGFALEMAASLSVALVAVSIGLRLVGGDLGLWVGLFVLMLAPEAFLPLRQVGVQFHAASEGVAATDAVFEVVESAGGTALPSGNAASSVVAGRAPVREVDRGTRIGGLSVAYGNRVAVRDFSAEFRAGTLTVLFGPSGAGKSSIIAAILGFVPFTGSIECGPIAWAGQSPGLLAGSVFENVTLGSEHPSPTLVARALELAAVDDVDPDRLLGVNGAGLSGGQAQRIAVARAIYRTLERRCGLLVLDEPSSALDAATEARLIEGIRSLSATGVAVLVVSHRAAFRWAADHVIELAAPPRAAPGGAVLHPAPPPAPPLAAPDVDSVPGSQLPSHARGAMR